MNLKLLIAFLMLPFCGKAQIVLDSLEACMGATEANPISFRTNSMYGFQMQPTYPEKDTLKCHFLEVVNDSTFKWESGFVIRERGFVSFGKTSVQETYLPVTSGIVTSPLFYNDMKPIKHYAIQVILKNKKP